MYIYIYIHVYICIDVIAESQFAGPLFHACISPNPVSQPSAIPALVLT